MSALSGYPLQESGERRPGSEGGALALRAGSSPERAMLQRWTKKRLLHYLPVLAMLLGSLPLLFGSSPVVAASCGSSTTGGSTGASPQIAHAPTISLETVTWELAQRHSPLSLADARFIVQSSKQTGIDDAFALAVWAAETQDGAAPVPGTHNIGNITAPQGVAWAHHIFAIYPTWQAGIAAWFELINRLYVHGGHATNLLTFALYYVHGLTPQELTPQEMQVLAGDYVHTLTTVITALQQHEAVLHPGQSGAGNGNSGSPGAGGGSSSTAPSQTLASLLPTNNLPPGWAGPGTRPAASAIKVSAQCGAAGAGLPPLVAAALQLGVYLRPNATGIFDHWVASTPDAISSQDGITWDTDFIASIYQHATGQAFPAYSAAAFWWDESPGNQPGWTRIPAGPGQFPQADDIAVLLDGARGEVALVVGVQLPKPGHPGFVLVLQGHAQHVLERWTLQADGTVLTNWSFRAVLQGYLRPPAS